MRHRQLIVRNCVNGRAPLVRVNCLIECGPSPILCIRYGAQSISQYDKGSIRR
ncbi:unnamed protein product [Spirodela intermedia]|uniref:Uncharacterized protein n=1 Tax=Spirodela intermedia TaxID=51605 RepID=A0A7I8KLF7_SPIIN|nr:unnamed protein product [Spirodela intermedia]